MRHALRRFSVILFASFVVACSGGRAPAEALGRHLGRRAAAGPARHSRKLSTISKCRLIVHTSIGGNQVRIHLSNEHGSKLTRDRGRAHRAAPARSGNRQYRRTPADFCRAQADCTITPGGAVVSDAVAFDVPAFVRSGGHAVVCPGIAEATTQPLARAADELRFGAGQRTADGGSRRRRPSTAGHSSPASTWCRAANAAAVVVFGDSTVDGDGSTANANRRWPDYLARSCLASSAGVGRVRRVQSRHHRQPVAARQPGGGQRIR